MRVPEGLTKDVLRQLYEVELLTETEIAEQFGTYQVHIGRVRRAWGFPTLGKAGRLRKQLPMLTPEQEQVLVGSLLGDGGMTASSHASARFSESHKADHAAYVEWKAEVFGAYTSSLRRGTKTDKETGKVYHNRSFLTHSCPQLRPFYDLFYPPPHRKRVFPADLYKRMTSLVLAVWYMDDGSCSKNGHPRISFGLDDLSLKRAFRALRTLGLNPKVYGEGSDQAIRFKGPGAALKFSRLIAPHLHSVMSYKLPPETPRRLKDENARRLVPEHALHLYESGMTMGEIALVYSVGKGTVRRRLKVLGVGPLKRGPRKRKLTLEAATEILRVFPVGDWEIASELRRDEMIADVIKTLRLAPFPQLPEHPERVPEMVTKVRKSSQSVGEDHRLTSRSHQGTVLCAGFFPNRYQAAYQGRKTAFEAWHDDKELARAVRLQFRVGDPVIPRRVLRAVTLGCRTPTIFRPVVARWVCETFLSEGGRIWDPCMGYGGRLLGAIAAKVEYTGTDVELETVAGNQRLADAAGIDADLHCCAAEDFLPPSVGLVFTSPPYFDREQYSGGEQSWKRYGKGFDTWVKGFLRPVIRSAAKALESGGHLVLNIADLKRRGKVIPLVDRATELAIGEGLVQEPTIWMPLSSINRRNAQEPLLVFKKVS